jgi:hypothetical protein
LKNQQIRVREEWDLLKPITTVIPAQAGGVVQEEWYRDAPFTDLRMASRLLNGGGIPGLFASLTLRADFQSFNAFRAFVRPAPE